MYKWLPKYLNSLSFPPQGKTKSAPRSSTPTQLLPTQNSADFQTTDSDEEKDPVRGTSLHTKMSDVTSLNCFNND